MFYQFYITWFQINFALYHLWKQNQLYLRYQVLFIRATVYLNLEILFAWNIICSQNYKLSIKTHFTYKTLHCDIFTQDYLELLKEFVWLNIESLFLLFICVVTRWGISLNPSPQARHQLYTLRHTPLTFVINALFLMVLLVQSVNK